MIDNSGSMQYGSPVIKIEIAREMAISVIETLGNSDWYFFYFIIKINFINICIYIKGWELLHLILKLYS